MTTVNNTSNNKEENKKSRKTIIQGKDLVGFAMIGVGIFAYGYLKGASRGYDSGRKRGFIDGEVFANRQFHELANHLMKLKDESKED